MSLVKKFLTCALLVQISCGSGGPLTPLDSFNGIKNAVKTKDSEAIVIFLSTPSLDKISKFKSLIKNMTVSQLENLADKYGYTAEKLRNLKTSDAVALYFFSDTTGVNLARYFNERVVSVDIDGNMSSVKTESGVELIFLREGPYWKFDLSDL